MVLAGMAIFMNSRKFFLVASSELLSAVLWQPRQVRSSCSGYLGVQFHPQSFRQRAHSRLGGAVDSPAGGEHFDPENRSDINDVTALLLLHVRQAAATHIEVL